ncbi:MAG: GNAT family N-acetyltransferase [Azonexus sp.]|jgi:ribosomal protein S18 acetylase RimI-like enzyme|nr:GNAT family N-acetyltransferase [Azonexus sp.]
MKPRNIAIRPATPAEIPAIAALARQIWQAAYLDLLGQGQIDYMLEQRYNHRQLQGDLDHPDKWFDLAFAQGRLAGFAATEIYAGEFKLDKLYVDPALQRGGIGGQLIAHVAARASELGFPAVILAVNKRNERAIAAYRKHGFSVREAKVSDIGGGFIMDDFIMEKLLRARASKFFNAQ